jgi:hypothetical protein
MLNALVGITIELVIGYNKFRIVISIIKTRGNYIKYSIYIYNSQSNLFKFQPI